MRCFREDCTYNGTAAISQGGGYASCSGDGVNWNGAANASIEFISRQFCGLPVTGWCAPDVSSYLCVVALRMVRSRNVAALHEISGESHIFGVAWTHALFESFN